MKQYALIVAFITSLSFFCNAQNENEEPFPNVLKVNPISLAFGNINLNYQRALNNNSAIQIGANYWYKIFGTDVSGIGLRGGYQFFLTSRTKIAPEGFYIGPQISFNTLTEKSTDVSVTMFGIGVMLGYQWVWNSGIALDLGIGPIYQFASESESDTSFEGFLPNATIALGYNF